MFRTSDGQVISAGRSWSQDGVTHPRNWNIWSAEYKASLGITEIIEEPHPDSKFYKWSQNEDLTYNQTERSLSDVPQVDRDGNTVNDADGNQIIYDGLKTIWIARCKITANTLLAPTDWQVIAKAERDRAIDSGVATYRAAVISACTAIEEAITGAANMAAFQALFDTPVGGNAPVHDWPEGL
jgi:hypothetical protein